MTEQEFPLEVQRLAKRVANNPTSRAFVSLADEYIKRGLLEEAVWVLTDGISHHPTYVAARMMLANLYLQTKQVSEAKAEFERVIHIHPDNVSAHKKLALIYREADQLGEAIQTCNRILMIDPKDKETNLLLTSIQGQVAALQGIDRLSASDRPVEVSHPVIFPEPTSEWPALQLESAPPPAEPGGHFGWGEIELGVSSKKEEAPFEAPVLGQMEGAAMEPPFVSDHADEQAETESVTPRYEETDHRVEEPASVLMEGALMEPPPASPHDKEQTVSELVMAGGGYETVDQHSKEQASVLTGASSMESTFRLSPGEELVPTEMMIQTNRSQDDDPKLRYLKSWLVSIQAQGERR